MARIVSWVAAGLSLSFGAAGIAALQAPAASDTINVIGRKPTEVRQEAKDFVRRTGVAERPVARWIDPICPKVLGVSDAIAGKVEARIREVAQEAKARIARGPCRANIIVNFAGDGGALIREIAAKAPNRLMEVPPEARPLLLDGSAPIRWWHTSEVRTKDGMGSIGNDAPPAVTMRGEQPGGVPLPGDVHQQYRSSFLSTQLVRALKSATIIVDANKAGGVPLESVSAFAALVGLAEIQLDEDTPDNSILGLFAAGGPRDLTPLDTGFLRALYRLPLDRTANMQRGLLIRGIVAPPKR